MSKIIEAKCISRVFKDAQREVLALENINLDVQRAEYAAIVGPSGSGKSTLVHILGGLDSPSQGEVFFEGKNMKRLTAKEIFALRNKKIGFMFQFYHLISELTVLENIMLPALLSGQGRAGAVKKAREVADCLEILERLDFYPGQLSGGQQQRTALARALINEPAVLFCDEPTGNLDHASSENIRGLLKSLNKINKTTIVLVTHNLELAKDAQRVLNIKEGNLI